MASPSSGITTKANVKMFDAIPGTLYVLEFAVQCNRVWVYIWPYVVCGAALFVSNTVVREEYLIFGCINIMKY